jgi:hypothetical protein
MFFEPENECEHGPFQTLMEITNSLMETKLERDITSSELPTSIQTRSKSRLTLQTDNRYFPSKYAISEQVDIAASDNVWCSAHIVAVFFDRATPAHLQFIGGSGISCGVTVRYEGWSARHDEDIFEPWRIRPPGSHVQKHKGWVFLNNNLPYWPCIIHVRTVVKDRSTGMNSLLAEDRIFVKLWGPPALCTRPWNKGVWLLVANVRPFSSNFDRIFTSGQVKIKSRVAKHWTRAVCDLLHAEYDASGSVLQDKESLKFNGSLETSE